MTTATSTQLSHKLQPENNQRLNNLCGPLNQHIKQIEKRFDVKISNQCHQFLLEGQCSKTLELVWELIEELYQKADCPIVNDDLNRFLSSKKSSHAPTIQTKLKKLTGKTDRQNKFINALESACINFAIGPAGTGKTYLSVAKAVEYIENAKVDRLVFVRPAVEAGERLGFLPGDMTDKVQPYLRPIYDALYQLMGTEYTHKLIQNDIIEIAPLAFMRGRTLNNAFILLDEAQNTTIAQMKMFLTRLGFGSKMVITGDVTQTDLPKGVASGLPHAIKLMKNISDIKITKFNQQDIVRHGLVAKIIQAYDTENHREI